MSLVADQTIMSIIAEAVSGGQCILFLGAGVHSPPPPEKPEYIYPENERPPMGRAFSESLAGKCSFSQKFPRENAGNLQRVSLCYEIDYQRTKLVDELRKAVDIGKKPSPLLNALARLNFPLIVTTNYDQLFEVALYGAGKRPVKGIYNKDENTPTDDHMDASTDRPFIFKIHGDIDQPESIVITDEDYIQFVLRMSDKDPYNPVPETFRYRFKQWPTLFVGYSLLDYNLRLLFMTLRWRMDKSKTPQTYSVDPYPDPLIFDVWHNTHKYVTFLAQDVWTFIPQLYEKVTGQPMP
ncbi:MAG TPA: SIR2 family protein [Blastocatellia bacterium]|nr:SIR2 family protein [Blastocatellia bacterium]